MIVDTNVLSAFADGSRGAVGALKKADEAGVPVIVPGEFIYGIAHSNQRCEFEAWMDRYLPTFRMFEYSLLGRPISANDV